MEPHGGVNTEGHTSNQQSMQASRRECEMSSPEAVCRLYNKHMSYTYYIYMYVYIYVSILLYIWTKSRDRTYVVQRSIVATYACTYVRLWLIIFSDLAGNVEERANELVNRTYAGKMVAGIVGYVHDNWMD